MIGVSTLVDVLASKPTPILRYCIPAILTVAILVDFGVSASDLIERPGWIVSKQEYGDYREAFPNAHAVYLSHFPVIAYFMNTDRQPRQFVRRIWDTVGIDEYRMTGAGRPATEIFYDKDREIPDLNDQTLYQSLAHCLQQSGVPELTLYFNIPGAGSKLPAPPDVMKRTVIENAAREGLSTTKVVVAGSAVFAGFTLLNDIQAKN